MDIFAVAIISGLIVATLTATVVWLVRRANGRHKFPIAVLLTVWPLGAVAVFVWSYFQVLETT